MAKREGLLRALTFSPLRRRENLAATADDINNLLPRSSDDLEADRIDLEVAARRAKPPQCRTLSLRRQSACLLLRRARLHGVGEHPVDLDPGGFDLGGESSPRPSPRVQSSGLLAGRPPNGQTDRGDTICACFNVGETLIVDAIRAEKLSSAEAIGAMLQAGTNCGFCIPELDRLLAAHR